MIRSLIYTSVTVVVGLSISIAIYRFMQEKFVSPYDPDIMPLFRKVVGSGTEKLVLIHGLTGSSRFWLGRMDPILNSHRVLVVDLLGFGRSPKPDADYSLSTHGQAVIRVMKEEGFYQNGTTIMGHSLGAIVAASVLESGSDLKFKGVLMSTPVYNSEEEAKTRLSSVSPMHRGMIEGSALWHLSCYFMDTFRLPIFMPLSGVPFDVHFDALSHTWLSLSRSLHASIVSVNTVALVKRAAKKQPILMLHAIDDQVASFDVAQNVAQSSPQVEFKSMGEGGHNGFLKQPELYWQKSILP